MAVIRDTTDCYSRSTSCGIKACRGNHLLTLDQIDAGGKTVACSAEPVLYHMPDLPGCIPEQFSWVGEVVHKSPFTLDHRIHSIYRHQLKAQVWYE